MGRPIEEAVQKWLYDQGSPFEFEVAEVLEQEELRVFQSVIYEDPAEDKLREVDLVAHLTNDHRCEVVIECKSGGSGWVVLASPDGSVYADSRWFIGRPQKVIDAWLSQPRIQMAMRLPPPRAYVLKRLPGKDGDGTSRLDLGHAALSSIVSATAARRRREPDLHLAALVIAGPLVRVSRQRGGGYDVQQVGMQRLLWAESAVLRRPVIVDVVTRDELPMWARGIRATLEAFRVQLDAAFPRVQPDP
jgi:hypothetical protein